MTKEVITDKATVSVYIDPFNRRVRIDDYTGDRHEVLAIINQQISGWVEKLIVKSRTEDVPFFISHGFTCEAFIKGYFAGTDMYFVTLYFTAGREHTSKWHEEQSILQSLIMNQSVKETPSTEEVKIATLSQALELARLYKEIFKVYPTPLQEETHIIKTMQAGTVYAYIELDRKIVSAASAEVNGKFHNSELTDCATLPSVAGKGHMKKLLYYLEQKLISDGITCCYTIARAESLSMNKAFAQLGYTYGGRLVNNCLIYSGLEDMNVWYKVRTMIGMINTNYPESELTGKIIGCAMEVHKFLGNGFQEVVYQRSLAIEMKRQGLAFSREHEMEIFYKGEQVGLRRVDFFVEGKIMVELKAVVELEDVHLAQAINYLEAYGMKIGLLINFGNTSLQFKRVMKPRGNRNKSIKEES